MEERERVKIVDYQGSKQIDRTKIDEKLRELNVELRLDSFLDQGTVRRVEGVLRSFMAEKGFTNAEVSHTITPVAGGPKLVNVTFLVNEGPKIKIRSIEFVGNEAIGDGTLQRKLKENKPKGIISFITGSGTYKESEYEADVERVVEYYQNHGYVRARVGQPELKTLENTKDGKTRWIQLRIPVTEGPRYRIGELGFSGNTLVKSEALRPLFELEKGEWYSRKKLEDGRRKSQEIYGGAGYMEFTAFPDLVFSDDPTVEDTMAAQVPEFLRAPARDRAGAKPVPVADVTMRIEEGAQYFVNRITFTGNTTTRDNVIRREMRLLEGSVFSTEALKFSVRRLNQLGYFKNLEGNDKDMKVEKTPGKQNAVDVTLKFEEQNRNQLTFGAGVSQYRGHLRPARVPDLELHGPRREPDAVDDGRRPVAELPARVHRAVPLRSQHHRRLRHLQALAAVHRLLHAEVHRRQPGVRVPGGQLQPHVLQLLVRDDEHRRSQRGAHRPVVPAAAHGLLDHLVGGRPVAADADPGRHPAP